MTSPLYRLPPRDADLKSRAFLRGFVLGGLSALLTLWLLFEALPTVRGWLWN
jgi:hypothetical protein